MITVDAITSFDDFLKTREFWNDLVSRSDNDSPFSRFEWFMFFWQKFCHEAEPLVLVIKDAGEPVAVAPLLRKKIRWRGLPATYLGFMANYFSIRTGIIAAERTNENLLEPIFRFLKGSRIGFDLFIADLIVKNSVTDTMLARHTQRCSPGYTLLDADRNPYVRIEGSWEDYLATRSKHQRFNIRHLTKLYERTVKYAVTTYTSQKLDEAADKMLLISKNSWKHTQGTGICDDPAKIDFYRTFMTTAAAAGWLQFKILEIDGVPAAFSYELKYGTTTYILKIGYNDMFRKLAPGAFLMHRSIKEAFDTNCRECELLGASEEWKLKMCDHYREHVKYWIFNDSPYGKILHAWEHRIVAAAKYIRGRKKRDVTGSAAATGADIPTSRAE